VTTALDPSDTGTDPATGLGGGAGPEPELERGADQVDAVAAAADHSPGGEATDAATQRPDPTTFRVSLEVFEGPFDLLLSLIAKHQLDVTEVALSQVTDEFIAHIRAFGEDWDLEQATHFLVVAATLLDLKAARLLPSGDVEDEDDLALLEARDLLFARLLQYRAYKEVAALIQQQLASASRRFPRAVAMEPAFAQLLPEVLLGLGPEAFADLAARALTPKPVPVVDVSHVHAPRVSVREQAAVLVDRLRRLRTSTFRSLVSDAEDTVTVVARFLALLELFREGAVAFDQLQPLGELTIRWTGAEEGELDVHDEFDDTEPGGDGADDDRDEGASGADLDDSDDDADPQGLVGAPADDAVSGDDGAQPSIEEEAR
jgi:segregation and condensation protein A